MKIIKQAAAIPYRIKKDQIEILILTSRNNKKWIVPKGIIEKKHSAALTALKETEEEAGVSGQIIREVVGTYKYEKWGGVCRVKVFPLRVTEVFDKWDEMEFRKRKWVKPKEAISKVKPKKLSKLISKSIRIIKKNAT